MEYRLTFVFILSLSWLFAVSCQLNGNIKRTINDISLSSADTIYTISTTQPSFRQSLKETSGLGQKKFVRITAVEIINPAQVAIGFDLYFIVGSESKFLGSVSPFPANNPGSYIIATAGKLHADGELELRLKFPGEWNRKDRLEVKMKALSFE